MASIGVGRFKDSHLQQVFHLMQQEKDVNSQDMAALYDDWSTSYDQVIPEEIGSQRPLEVSSALAEVCDSKDIKVLDCGSGTGLIGEALKAKGFTNVSAADISQQSLDVAEKKGIYQKLFCFDIGKDKMPFNDHEFDALTCIGCIVPAHISPDAIRELIKIVKPGGVFIFSSRECFIEVIQGEEEFYSQKFSEKFHEVMEDLKNTKKLELMSKKKLPEVVKNYPTILYVYKVL
ncbi:methyltransferase-like protein 27 [Apostichopus japonicus]